MPLNDIVNVQITRQTQAVQQAGFGLLMILGTFKRFNDLIRKYTSMEGVAEDFVPSDPEYVAAEAVFSQSITPDAIFIGRRPADSATIDVITAMAARNYTVTINGTAYTLNNYTNTSQQSTLTLNADFVANNLIMMQLNGEVVGTVVSKITYSTPFTSGTSTITTVNGVAAGAGVPYTSSNAGTLTAIAAQLTGLTGVVASAVSNGTDTITVTFTNPGDNTVDSSITTGGSAPTATIVEGGFLFDTDQATTMDNIRLALLDIPTVQSVEILPSGPNPDRILAITTKPNQSSVIDFFQVNFGASQPTFNITTGTLPTTRETIANALAQLINDDSSVAVTQSIPLVTGNSTLVTLNGNPLTPVVYASSNVATLTAIAAEIETDPSVLTAVSDGVDTITITPVDGQGVEATLATTLGTTQPTWTYVYQNIVNATDNADGTLTVESTVPGTPWTLSVSTNIVNANRGLVTIQEANPNAVYAITLNNTLIQYTAPTDVQSNEQIATAMVGLINASTVAVSATDNGDGSFVVESNNEALTFTAQITPVLMTYQFGLLIEPLVPSEAVVDSLDAIQAVNDDWYALAIIDRTSGTVQQAAAWIEARIKIFGTASADPDIIDVPVGVDQTSIAAILNNLGYVRTFVLYHQDADSDFPECAWFGDCLPLTPGSETWAFKTLSSMSTSDLSANQSNNARSKRANTYEYVAGFGITQNGTMAQGEYIDIIRGIDWLVSTIQSYVFTILVQSPKLPYTDAGITAVEAQIRRALNEGITNNFIAAQPEYTVTVPRAIDVSSADKAARILRNVRFQATLAGAIQAVRIQGTVTV